MASRHLRRSRSWSRANYAIAIASCVVAFAAITAALAVNVVDTRPEAVEVTQPAAAAQQPVSQEGRLVAVSPTSVTAQSVDGFARTYLINGNTNAITATGTRIGAAATSFAVNDEVSIVGVVQGGTAIATAVADKQVSNLDGPPMDGV